MDKIMPIILAAVLMISTMSLLVGCGSGIEDDPNAKGPDIGDQGDPLTPEEKKELEAEKLTP